MYLHLLFTCIDALVKFVRVKGLWFLLKISGSILLRLEQYQGMLSYGYVISEIKVFASYTQIILRCLLNPLWLENEYVCCAIADTMQERHYEEWFVIFFLFFVTG